MNKITWMGGKVGRERRGEVEEKKRERVNICKQQKKREKNRKGKKKKRKENERRIKRWYMYLGIERIKDKDGLFSVPQG